jgi:hypothetical protein
MAFLIKKTPIYCYSASTPLFFFFHSSHDAEGWHDIDMPHGTVKASARLNQFFSPSSPASLPYCRTALAVHLGDRF